MNAGRAHFTVHTDVFDGPLDLLLHLVQRDGVDLAHFRVSDIASAYLEALDRLVAIDLAIAGDHLVMAATLVHLKSLELLGRPAVLDPDEPDPAEALAEQIRAHAMLRESAERLDRLPRVGRDVAVRSSPEPTSGRTLQPGDIWQLLDLYETLLRRTQVPLADVVIHGDVIHVEDALASIRGWLSAGGGQGALLELLAGRATRAERVVVFLAVLELCRLGEVDLHQATHLGPVDVWTRRRAA